MKILFIMLVFGFGFTLSLSSQISSKAKEKSAMHSNQKLLSNSNRALVLAKDLSGREFKAFRAVNNNGRTNKNGCCDPKTDSEVLGQTYFVLDESVTWYVYDHGAKENIKIMESQVPFLNSSNTYIEAELRTKNGKFVMDKLVLIHSANEALLSLENVSRGQYYLSITYNEVDYRVGFVLNPKRPLNEVKSIPKSKTKFSKGKG